MIEINVSDELTPTLHKMLSSNQRYLRLITKSLGWYVSTQIKTGVRTGEPGGEQFVERIPWKVRKDVQGGHAAKAWYGKMRSAIGYEYKNFSAYVGWTSQTSALYGKKQESGYAVRITDSVRKKWASAGHPLPRGKETLETPARPFFKPMARELFPKLPEYVNRKLEKYITGDVEFGRKNRRKYKVY